MLRDAGGVVAVRGHRLAALLTNLLVQHKLNQLECYLLAGVDVNVQDYSGRTLLHWAVATHAPEAEELLRAQGGLDSGVRDLDLKTAEDLRSAEV